MMVVSDDARWCWRCAAVVCRAAAVAAASMQVCTQAHRERAGAAIAIVRWIASSRDASSSKTYDSIRR